MRLLLPIVLMVNACAPTAGDNAAEGAPVFDEIAAEETVRFAGTEPFWNGEVTGGELTYSTPELPDGTTIAVERFTGNSGLGFSGMLENESFDLIVTRGTCSDAMSDREYPFTATLQIGEHVRSGCAWTDSQPFKGDAAP